MDKFIFKVATDRLYSPEGIWLLEEAMGGCESALTDYQQQLNGDMAFVHFKPRDDLAAGDEFAEMETIKATDSLRSPVAGESCEVNRALDLAPRDHQPRPLWQRLAGRDRTHGLARQTRRSCLDPKRIFAAMRHKPKRNWRGHEPNRNLSYDRSLERRALGPRRHGQRPGVRLLGPAGCPRSCGRLHARRCLCRRREHLRDDDVPLGRRAVQAEAALLRVPHRGHESCIELDRTEIFTRLDFKPKIRVAAGGEPPAVVEARVRRALQSAQKYSLVANSVKSEIVVDPEIVIEE